MHLFLIQYPLVLIEWEDSQLGFQGWKFIDEQKHENHLVHSVGYLIKNTKKFKVLDTHLSKDTHSENSSGSGDILIPTSAIVKISKLVLAKD